MKKTPFLLAAAVAAAALTAAAAEPWTPPRAEVLPETALPAISAARWIWFRCKAIRPKSTALFRHSAVVGEAVESAFFHAACDDRGRIFFNGVRLAPEPFDPAVADRFVRTYRIPAKLWRRDRNTIAAEVYNAAGQGGLMLRGEITLASGKKVPIVSNAEWRAKEAPAQGGDDRWIAPEFDDSGWEKAMELGDVMISPWRGACRRLLEFMLTPAERDAYRKLMDEKIGGIDFLRDAPDVKGKIVWRHGRAGIELNGKVEAPFIYIAGGSPWDRRNADAIIKMNAVGVKFIELQCNAGDYMIAPGKYEFDRLGDNMRRLVALAPDATFCLRVILQFGYSSWIDFYPDARIGYVTGPADGRGGELGRFRTPSMADPRVRREMADFAAALMDYAKKQPWYKRVTMIRTNHGVTSEWHYYGMENDMPDTSPEMTAAFRRYLAKKYGTDEALRKAWHRPEITLATAAVPGRRERVGADRLLRDPASTDRQTLDYYDCMQEVVADLLIHFAGCFKRADPRLLVGAYYGYLYTMAFPPEGQVLRFDKVLASPDIDFLSAPFCYGAAARHLGGDAQPRAVSDPFKRHGKLIIYEADTRTHIAGLDVPCTSKCRNAAESVAVLRNNIGRAFLDGGGVQFLEFAARAGRDPWFNHPEIYRTFRQSLELWQKLWNSAAPDPAARVAVVISPEELVRHGYPTRQPQQKSVPNLIDKPTHALLRSGVGCDIMTLRGFLETAHEYRIVVFLNVFSPSAGERRQLLAKVRRPGVVAIWNYAPGLITEAGYDEGAMSELCGIALRVRRERLPMAATLRGGGKLAAFWIRTPWQEDPRCYADDPRAEVLADYDTRPEAAVAMKVLADGSTAVFCGMPGITEEFWRRLWAKLGVPTISEAGSVVTAGNGRHLLVHSGKAGSFRLRLPGGAKSAVELFTGRRFPVADGILTLTAPTAMTWFLELE